VARVGVDVRAADSANGVRGAILLVVGVEDEENVESMLQWGIGPIARPGGGGTTCLRGCRGSSARRQDKRKACPANDGKRRRPSWASCDQAIDLLFARVGVKDVFGVVIKSGKGCDGGDEHAHGMGIVMEAVEKLFDALVDEGVMRDVVGPVLELGRGGKFAMQQEVSGL